jgi:hypothetical protein
MVSCKGRVDELLCLRDIEKEIAGQSSAMAISAVEFNLIAASGELNWKTDPSDLSCRK